uniref:ABC transporter ATP-binding protein n=1 Tax=Solibacillus sp. FSL H8-0523 TaxID=2954511 RepID=UPI004047090A
MEPLLGLPSSDRKEKGDLKRLVELMKRVGLKEEHLDRFPHEFSVDSDKESRLLVHLLQIHLLLYLMSQRLHWMCPCRRKFKGELVEVGETQDVFENPQHPYTEKLLSSVLSVPTEEIVGGVPVAKGYF